jgi:site-specific DNA-methyltransferase (adenine-specific)
MDVLYDMPDHSFNLAIVDPPYGIDINSSGRICKEHGRSYKEWDKEPPPVTYFKELKRVADNFIIWGANHFISRIPYDSRSWIVWDKEQPEKISFAMCELALTSFNKSAKIFRYSARKETAKEVRIHPTQKPVALYEWLLKNYAKPGDTILDTHNGSGSINIACDELGYSLTAIELDPEYYEAAKKRLIEHQRQLSLF